MNRKPTERKNRVHIYFSRFFSSHCRFQPRRHCCFFKISIEFIFRIIERTIVKIRINRQKLKKSRNDWRFMSFFRLFFYPSCRIMPAGPLRRDSLFKRSIPSRQEVLCKAAKYFMCVKKFRYSHLWVHDLLRQVSNCGLFVVVDRNH